MIFKLYWWIIFIENLAIIRKYPDWKYYIKIENLCKIPPPLHPPSQHKKWFLKLNKVRLYFDEVSHDGLGVSAL